MPHKGFAWPVVRSDGKTLATAGWGLGDRFWEADTESSQRGSKSQIPITPTPDLRMYAVCYASDGQSPQAHMDATFAFWKADTMTLRQNIDVHGSFVFGSMEASRRTDSG